MELQMMSEHLTKFTSAYLHKFFKDKNLPYEQWEINIDGVKHIVDNRLVIELILKAKPAEQKMIAETLLELESNDCDVNVFLKHLAFESSIFSTASRH